MDTPTSRGGSSVSAHARIPSIDLAKLAELLAEAIPHGSDPLGIGGLPLTKLDGQRLFLNTRGVLGRLLKNDNFRAAFAPSDQSGFVRDLTLPPLGTTAKVGGRLLPGTEATAAKAVEKLHKVVSAELDTALGAFDLRAIALPTYHAALQELADSSGVSLPELPTTASMVPIQFSSQERTAEDRKHDIARVLTAIETIDGNDWLDSLLASIRKRLTRKDIDADEIDAIVGNVRAQVDRPGSQIRRFLDFLEDDALARVRLQVTMRLMASVAEGGSAGLHAYVNRVQQCYEVFAGTKGESLLLDVSSAYGSASNVDLAEELRKALFYGCLAVWPEHSVQLFETRSQPSHGFASQREVSYRFRVNGTHPATGEPAYASRIERLRLELLEYAGERRVARFVAQAVFLYLVTPDSLEEPTSFDLKPEAEALAGKLKREPVRTLTEILGELTRRSSVMTSLASEVIAVLRNRSRRIVEAVDRTSSNITVAVNEGIVDYDAVLSVTSPKSEILQKDPKGADSVAWFRHLVISDTPVVRGSALSYTVRIRLAERSLAVAGGSREVRMERVLDAPTLPIRLVPYEVGQDRRSWVPALAQTGLFDAPCGVELQYDVRTLTLSPGAKDTEKATKEQWRIASCTAFTLLTYIAIWEVVRRVKKAYGAESVAATMFRLQLSGKEMPDSDGSSAVYAISQAVEKALAADIPVKLQGLVPTDRADQMRWRKRGALAALLGGQPLKFFMRGRLERVALVSYVTRPCDRHPAHLDADGFLFISRTYHAETTDDRNAVLKLAGMRSRYVESQKDFMTPQLILEEVARLRSAGFQHVLLLSHHYGNRHIGRASDRHSPHGSLEFLDQVADRFPDMRLYTLRRDVFPATRLRTRLATESGFEVFEYRDHQKMYDGVSSDLHRGLMPVYTFATLSVVGEESRPQSGFCTYFYDVEQRGVAREEAEAARQNIIGVGEGKEVRESLTSVLRALHFMESEKPAGRNQLLPVLDPFDWATPASAAAAGELKVMTRRGKGDVLLCFQAMLAHVTKVLHKETE